MLNGRDGKTGREGSGWDGGREREIRNEERKYEERKRIESPL